MKSIILFLSASMICANEPLSFERFVENYFLLSKSKMENSPSAWQDTREGYFRAYGAFKADQVIDSLNTKALNHYEAGIRHFKVCLLYTSPSPRDGLLSRMPSSA